MSFRGWLLAPVTKKLTPLVNDFQFAKQYLKKAKEEIMATVEEFKAEVLGGLNNIEADVDRITARLEEALQGNAAAKEAGIQEALTGLQEIKDRVSAVAAKTPEDEEPTPEEPVQ